MKFITNKEYESLISIASSKPQPFTINTSSTYQLENLKKEINCKDIEINNLREELRQARDLSSILEKLVLDKNNHSVVYGPGFNISCSGEISFTDDVAIYVPDILGGKVLKQEGIKCIKIDKDGNPKEGLTKQKPDKGFNYKLIREK